MTGVAAGLLFVGAMLLFFTDSRFVAGVLILIAVLLIGFSVLRADHEAGGEG